MHLIHVYVHVFALNMHACVRTHMHMYVCALEKYVTITMRKDLDFEKQKW